jgi:hypothetical protein
MTTASEICTAALRRANVVGKGDTPSADDSAEALGMLNRMMHAWKLRNVDVSHADYELTSTFALDPEYEEATVFLLAKEIALEYQQQISPYVYECADRGWRLLQAGYFPIVKSTVDGALLRMQNRHQYGNSR